MNRYVDTHAPWKKDITIEEEKAELESILFHTLTWIRTIALMMLPFFPEKSREILTRIGTPYTDGSDYLRELDQVVDTYTITEKWNPLYIRLELLP
jgi:methionyl-tRNA synthetase